MKKEKIVYIILLSACLVGCVVSRYYPFLIRLNIHSGDLNIPSIEYGYAYGSTELSLICLLSSLIVLVFTDSTIALLISSLLNLGMVFIIRFNIHSQGFIDHDFDTKTGFGFHLFFAFSVLHFLLILAKGAGIVWINYKTKATKGDVSKGSES